MSKNDSGPAFPRPSGLTLAAGGMGDPGCEGMSLRDYFAGKALAGLLASGPHDCEAPGIAHDAYVYADAMIAEREKKDE